MSFGIDDAIAAGLQVLNKFIPDPAAKAQAEKELRDSLQGWDQQQAAINNTEAASSSIFVAGWRPAIGWTCALAFFFIYILTPIVAWVGVLLGSHIGMPQFDTNTLMNLTMALLGLGGLRTFEKIKGVSK